MEFGNAHAHLCPGVGTRLDHEPEVVAEGGPQSFVHIGQTNVGLRLTAVLEGPGIHPDAGDVGSDLLPLFVSSAVTTNSLPAPELGPGTYCFLIQQTNAIVQSYSLEFVLEEDGVQVDSKTWGAVKALFR